jgi:heat shock protein HslJ
MVPAHVVLAVLIGAFAAGGTAQTPTTPAAEGASGLEGSAWNAVEVYGTPVTTDANADRAPHLVFGKDGRVTGADGCNRLTGPYTVKANGLTFGQLAGTRMACPDTDDAVKRFQAALKGTSHWSIVNGRLEIYGATGKPLAVFERREGDAKQP